MLRIHRKSIANTFWAFQIENELSEENKRDYVFSAPQAQERYLEEVDMKRANSVYHHESCSDECKKRGQKLIILLHQCHCCTFRVWTAVGN